MKTSQSHSNNAQSDNDKRVSRQADNDTVLSDSQTASLMSTSPNSPIIRPNNIVALQGLIGNHAVQRLLTKQQSNKGGQPPVITNQSSKPPLIIQRDMMTVQQWNEIYHGDNVEFTPYLQSIEDDLVKYHDNAVSTDPSAGQNKVESLFGLNSKASKRYSLPEEEYDKIPSPWKLGEIGTEAESLLENMTGGSDKIAKAKFAEKEQTEDRNFLKNILDEGFAQDDDLRLKNSCEWVLKDRAKLYVLTPTGDTVERAKAASEEMAYFPNPSTGKGHVMDSLEMYNKDDISDNTNVKFASKSSLGYNLQGLIAIYRPREQGRSDIEETLRHEVQHDADRSWDTKNELEFGSPKHKFERYKTEYRAYNYEGGKFDNLSHARKETHSLDGSDSYEWTEKQWAIFQHIYKLYSHTETGWKDDPDDIEGDKSFREAVVAYVNPDDKGFNKLNSIRIDDFYNALDKVPLNTSDPEDSKVQDTIKAAKALTTPEAEAVLKQSPEMLKKMEAHLKDEAFEQVKWVIAPTMPTDEVD